MDSVKVFTEQRFVDGRGYTAVQIDAEVLRELKFHIDQINQGLSLKSNTLRGLHFQAAPHSQAKLVSCVYGAIWSVAVDIRANSPDFGKYTAELLTGENGRLMYVPKGFAHGYLTIEDNTLVQWCTDGEFCPSAARAVRFDDKDIIGVDGSRGIGWPIASDAELIISDKDKNAMSLKSVKEPEKWTK